MTATQLPRRPVHALVLGLLLTLPAAAPAGEEDPVPAPPTLDAPLEPAGREPRPSAAAQALGLPQGDLPPPDSGEGLTLSVEDAVLMALRHNRSLAAEQLQPAITGTFEAVERAVFDPELFAEASASREESVRQFSEVNRPPAVSLSQREQAEAGLRQSLPTGTDIELTLSASRSERRDQISTTEQFTSRAGLTLTQALLQGARIDSNLASLRQARVDTAISRYAFRGFAESLVADVEQAYWDYVLASRNTAIYEESLEVARRQLEETRQRIRVGDRPETEETSALAEVALRRQGLIDARSQRARARIRLLQLINPPAARWDSRIQAEDSPTPDVPPLEPVAAHLQLAMDLRPDLNEARLQLQRGELEVVRTRQGLLPRLDLFITLGRSGYADSFGSAWRAVDDEGYDYSVGLQFSHPLGNRAGEADARRARLSREQALESLYHMEQLTALDVQNAWYEANRTREQIAATRQTRILQEQVLETEQTRFRVGSGTALAVAQAQRDLLESRLDEMEAIIRHRQALTDLYRQSGTLLLRRGIEAPGDTRAETAY
ncbi:Outer membrane protein TolC [Ectothiorhodospira mobilis]|uniref:Outer membrane protein TolC n=1 Tax=Ectothiorhodospira mobilis TaxID=195064 RepID=A0A1I4PNS9_ECTMO|nr:TolC family protein [Ectothiorhodospira mobilis]SFM29399.1 Outer membrane protein TolC [Ectothiorhodospira mobilis]